MFYTDDVECVFFSRSTRERRWGARPATERSGDACVKLGVKKRWVEGSFLVALGGVAGFLVTAFDPERGLLDPPVILLGLVATLPPLFLLPWNRRHRSCRPKKMRGLRQLPRLHMMQTSHALLLLAAVIIWTVRAWGGVIALIGA